MNELRTSTPGMDAWRPHDRMTYGEAAWLGAAWGLAMHAALHFFSVAIPSLEVLLVIFRPAENLAFGLTTELAPLARWFMLLLCQAGFWAFVGTGILGVVHEVTDAVRARRHGHAQAPVPSER